MTFILHTDEKELYCIVVNMNASLIHTAYIVLKHIIFTLSVLDRYHVNSYQVVVGNVLHDTEMK